MLVEALVLRRGQLNAGQRAQITQAQVPRVTDAKNVEEPGEGDHAQEGALTAPVLHILLRGLLQLAQILNVQRLGGLGT